MTTTPATQSLLPVTPEDEDFAKAIAQAVMVWGAPHFKHMVSFNVLCEAIEPVVAAHRKAQSLPGDVGTAIDQAILWARDDKCSYPADAEKFEQRIGILRAALTPSPLLALVAGYADYKAISDDRWEQGKAAGYRELGEMVTAALTPSALSGDAGEVERLRAALEPFAAMGRVMETRARVTFGKMPKDSEIVCESSGEAGMGILTMGHFRDAAATLPDAPGWGGMYKPLPIRAALPSHKGAGE